LDILALTLYVVNGLIPFVFTALLYKRYSEKRKRFYLYWLIGFTAYGLTSMVNAFNYLEANPSPVIGLLMPLFSLIAFISIATGVGELIKRAQSFFIVSLGAPVILFALSISGLYSSTLNLMFMVPYLIITVGLVTLQIKYHADLGLPGLGWFLILIANIGYSTGNVSFVAAPFISFLGKSIVFYWMTQPRFSMITDEFEKFMMGTSNTTTQGAIITMVETSTKQQDLKWIRNQIIEGGSKGIRSILVLSYNHVTDETLLKPELMDLPDLYIVEMTQKRHPLGDVFSERVMSISTDINELSLLLNDIRDFIVAHGIKSQILFYNVSTLIFMVGWKRIYTFLISLLPLLKTNEILSYFIYSPEAHERQYEVEIMRHLGDRVIKTG
jgi:hypothetical protein